MSPALTARRLDGRLPPPITPTIEVLPPPAAPNGESAGLTVVLAAVPLLGSLGAVAFLVAGGSSLGAARYLLAGLLVIGSVAFVVVGVWRTRSLRATAVAHSRRSYLIHLGGVRDELRAAARRQRAYLDSAHPEPRALASLAADGGRVWERSPAEPDWLRIRYAGGQLPLAADLRAASGDDSDGLDLVSVAARRRLLAAHRAVDDLPLCVSLASAARIVVTGDSEPSRALARAIVAQAATLHDPDHLLIAILTNTESQQWNWVKWLPHCRSPRASDYAGGRRLVAASPVDLQALLPDMAGPAHLLLVIDGVALPLGHPLTSTRPTTVLDLGPHHEPRDDDIRLHIHSIEDRSTGPVVTCSGPSEAPVTGSVDQLGVASAEAVARRLSARRAGAAVRRDPLTAEVHLLDLLGVSELPDERALFVRPAQAPGRRLRVPIGLGADGQPVELDLKESAEHGMGPHGLVVGATGSGKSELLRTLVLGLMLTHPPEELNVVLVDFKGGATFAGMAAAPHVSAVITNLSQELSLVERTQDVLTGELTRRQELLRANGNHASLRHYESARANSASPDLPPLPTLLVVVDEFSELLAARPELIDLFVAIGRLGRSLGIHLLLASQRLEEGRLRGLDSHLSYRIALRTFSASESRSVIGVADAYELPSVPGLALLRPGPGELVPFKAAYVSGPLSPRAALTGQTPPPRRELMPFTAGEVRSGSLCSAATPPRPRQQQVPTAAVSSTARSSCSRELPRMSRTECGCHRWIFLTRSTCCYPT